MTEHVCELEIITGHSGFFYARCIIKNCDVELNSAQILGRLNATERLSAEMARSIANYDLRDYKFPEEGKYQSDGWSSLRAYANMLEGKDD